MNMKTSKIQLRGNCQCCGRDQAVMSGRMSNHGYTVEHGWFNGVCNGHNFEPLQVSREKADAVCVNVRQQAKALRKNADKVAAGKMFPITVKLGWGKNAKEVPFAEASATEQQNAVRAMEHAMRNRADAGEAFAELLEGLANSVHGSALREVKLDKPQIEVGSKVKVWGDEYIVEAIEWRIARGIGPSLNGKQMEHVKFTKNGHTCYAPKRFARLV